MNDSMDNDSKELDLLYDLAKLIKKYGTETFEGLAKQMSKPDFIQQFVEILSTTAKASRTAPKSKRKSASQGSRVDFRSSLINLGKSEEEKSALLVQLYDGLMSRSLLPTLREMRDFVLDHGLPSIKSPARDKAIVPFVKTFLSMPLEDVKMYLKDIRPTSSYNDDRSLEGWSNIIFRRSERLK